MERDNEPHTYRKRPLTVTALQLRWDTWQSMCAFAGVGLDIGTEPAHPYGVYIDGDGNEADQPTDTIGMVLPTLEGPMLAREGDYIVRGIRGELYRIERAIFEDSYDRVPDDEVATTA